MFLNGGQTVIANMLGQTGALKNKMYCIVTVLVNAEFMKGGKWLRMTLYFWNFYSLKTLKVVQFVMGVWGNCGHWFNGDISWNRQYVHKHLQLTLTAERTQTCHLHHSEPHGNPMACSIFWHRMSVLWVVLQRGLGTNWEYCDCLLLRVLAVSPQNASLSLCILNQLIHIYYKLWKLMSDVLQGWRQFNSFQFIYIPTYLFMPRGVLGHLPACTGQK